MVQKFTLASRVPVLPLIPWLCVWMVLLKTGLGVHKSGRTGVHHFPHGNQESCQSGIAIADLVSRFAPWDAGESQSFVRPWEE